MNIRQAKQLPLTSLMTRLGYEALKEERGGTELKYLSPLREESEPSFNVNRVKNAWFDFGAGEGGNVVDFAIAYLHYHGHPSQVKDALSWLDTLTQGAVLTQNHPSSPSSFSPQAASSSLPKVASMLSFIQATPVAHPAILTYLQQQRAIPLPLIHRYLREVTYRHQQRNKEYFAFGMANRSGGWEIRSASDRPVFKSALITKDITLFSGDSPSSGTLHLFEGMLDFLSLLAMQGRQYCAEDVLILHSVTAITKAIAVIHAGRYRQFATYFDHDPAGKGLHHQLADLFPHQVQSFGHLYSNHGDLNAAWIDSNTINLSTVR